MVYYVIMNKLVAKAPAIVLAYCEDNLLVSIGLAKRAKRQPCY